VMAPALPDVRPAPPLAGDDARGGRPGRRWRARSLAGQMALLVAIGLFVAQAANFALLLRERRTVRLAQVAGPAAARMADAAERWARTGPPPMGARGRVRRDAAPPATAGLPLQPAVAAAVLASLRDAGLPVTRVVAALRPIDPRDPPFRRRRGFPPPDVDSEAVIAARLSDSSWMSTRVPWWGDGGGLVWRLAMQTLILYAAVLLPVLWAARRIAAPLRDLTRAAERFGQAGADAPVAARGPSDVTALIAAFDGLRRRVTAMLDEKDRMLGAIGHDLRTPLAALRVRIEGLDDTDRRRSAELIDGMSVTLDDILSLARLGRAHEPATEVDLAALVDAAVEDFRDLGNDVTFADHPRLALRMRPNLLRRAVRNLIDNAVTYAGAAEVRIAADARVVAVVVADRGPGIPPDRLADVLEPFTRLEGSRNRDTGGTGLGLALARAIARDAGGDLALANRDGGGLEAVLTVPR